MNVTKSTSSSAFIVMISSLPAHLSILLTLTSFILEIKIKKKNVNNLTLKDDSIMNLNRIKKV